MSRYVALDDLIVAKCRAPQTFSVLAASKDIAQEADRLAAPDRWGDRHGWRVVDRRLQALRKAGRVKFSRTTGWVAA